MRRVSQPLQVTNFPMADTSADNLNIRKSNYTVSSPTKSYADPNSRYDKAQRNKAKKQGLDILRQQDYQPARYSVALQYKNSRSYMKKLPSGQYQNLDLLEDTDQLKQFGLGTYFFIQLFRRVTWLLFVLSLLEGLCLYITINGNGLSNYSSSFSTYLILTTFGLSNYSGNQLTPYDGYIVTIIPGLVFLALLLFYFLWKGHFVREIFLAQEDSKVIKPEKFCVEVEGMDPQLIDQIELQRLFSKFGPIYEVSLVRRYKNKLECFEELNEMEEELKEEELELILGSGDKQTIAELRKKKDKLSQQISQLKIMPKTISAFIHFQFETSKVDCLTYFNTHYLFSNCGHSCMRTLCCCCVDQPAGQFLFNGKKLMIKNQTVPSPEDINWLSYEINLFSKIFRIIFAFLIILIFLAVSCTIIGLCSIYISSHSSNCDGTTLPTSVSIAAASSAAIQQCYCNANLFASFTDSSISTFCQSYNKQIWVQQGIQYSIIATQTIVNILFGFIVQKIVACVRPISQSTALTTKTTIFTIFLIFNTVLLPILIYANIFGFKTANYVSFLTLISSDFKKILSVDSLAFYVDIAPVWYRNVSPIFTNYLIINTVMVWIFFFINKCISNYESLEDEQGRMLQKTMNAKITSFKVNAYKQVSNTYMTIFMIFLLSAGIPVLVPLGFLNLLSRYLTTRSLLQNNSSRIEGLGEDFSSLSFTLFAVILITCPMVSCWMLTANGYIYDSTGQNVILQMQLPILQNILPELTRELYLPFFIIISIVAFAEYFLYNTLIRFCSFLCGLCYERKQITRSSRNRSFAEHTKSMNMLTSYNIRNNDQLRNAILNLEKHLVDNYKE